jgi:hypothetical protein
MGSAAADRDRGGRFFGHESTAGSMMAVFVVLLLASLFPEHRDLHSARRHLAFERRLERPRDLLDGEAVAGRLVPLDRHEDLRDLDLRLDLKLDDARDLRGEVEELGRSTAPDFPGHKPLPGCPQAVRTVSVLRTSGESFAPEVVIEAHR